MTQTRPTAERRSRRALYAAAALALIGTVLMPLVGSPPAGALVIEPELKLKPGDVYVHEDATSAPFGINAGLDPEACLTGGNIYNPASELACHQYNVVVDAPRDLILTGRLQLDVEIQFPVPLTLNNCPGVVIAVTCASHTMAAEAWQDPPLQELEPGRQIHVDFPAIGYLEYPDDPATPVCGYIDGLPRHDPLPGQDRSTVTCGGDEGTLSDVPSGRASEQFGSDIPPLVLAVVEAGKCPFNKDPDPEVQQKLKEAEGVCPNIAVQVASPIGITEYRIIIELVNLDTIPKVDKSFDPDFLEPFIPGDGSIPPTSEPAPAIGSSGGLVAPGEPIALPGSTLPGFGAPDGALSGIKTGTAIGNDDLAAAIIGRNAKPLPPAGDASTALMLTSMVFFPVGGLATLLAFVVRRRHRDDALVAGVGTPSAA